MTPTEKTIKETPHKDESPAVSVIIPAYRAAKFIATALESVFAQTFTDFEIIVINDGSPDTDELERVLADYSGRIIYLRQKNGGPAAARNSGILAASGRWVAFLDADDYWYPDFLSEQMAFLSRDPTLDLVYANALLVGEAPLAGRTFMDATPSKGEVTFESLLDERCTVLLSGVVARRQTVIDAGLFDENFHYAEDYDLWLRIAKRGARLSYQRKVLLCKRWHAESLCADDLKFFENALHVLDKVGRSNDLSESERESLIRHENKLIAYMKLEHGKINLSRGHFSAAVEAFREANEFYRSWKLRWVVFWLRLWPNLLCRIYNYYRPLTIQSRQK
ncbi:MAG TPA: glycosyltransferase [Blastocatellia bacterium]